MGAISSFVEHSRLLLLHRVEPKNEVPNFAVRPARLIGLTSVTIRDVMKRRALSPTGRRCCGETPGDASRHRRTHRKLGFESTTTVVARQTL